MSEDRERFKQWLSMGRCNKVVNNYLLYYDRFGDHKDIFNPDWVRKFIIKYQKSPAPISFFKRYLEFMMENYDITKEQLAYLRGIKVKVMRPKIDVGDVISEPEMFAVANAMPCLRDQLMVLLNYYGGLRVNKLANIVMADFKWLDWETDKTKCGELVIHYDKGNKSRIVTIPPNIMEIMYNWMKEAIAVDPDVTQKMFNIGPRRYQILLKEAGLKALGKRVHPHMLRRSIATRLLKGGMDIFYLQRFMGHSDIASTQRYVNLNIEDIKDKYKEIMEST